MCLNAIMPLCSDSLGGYMSRHTTYTVSPPATWRQYELDKAGVMASK